MKSQFAKMCAVVIFTANAVFPVRAQAAAIIPDRDGSTLALEPYAQNIIRVTLSTMRDSAVAAPGYGFVRLLQGKIGSMRGKTKTTSSAVDCFRLRETWDSFCFRKLHGPGLEQSQDVLTLACSIRVLESNPPGQGVQSFSHISTR